MRRGSIIGLMLAASMGMVGAAMLPAAERQPAIAEPQPVERKRRREAAAPVSYWKRLRPTGTRTQRHTGAGGAGMHRAWKKRRASGRH